MKKKKSSIERWPKFGENIERIRHLVGVQEGLRRADGLPDKLSQDEFAKRIGRSRSQVAAWESGTKQPKKEVLEKICYLFDLDPDKVTHGEVKTLGLNTGMRTWPLTSAPGPRAKYEKWTRHLRALKESITAARLQLEQMEKLLDETEEPESPNAADL